MTEHRVVRLAFYSLVMVLGISLGAARSVEAAEIGLSTPLPLGGSSASVGQVFDLTVSFDLNCVRDVKTGACVTGSSPSNLVSQDLYVDFSGLEAVPDSYGLGSVWPSASDLMATRDGLCAPGGPCSVDTPSSALMSARYQSLLAALAPITPTGPGGLFSMQFKVTDGDWALNVIGYYREIVNVVRADGGTDAIEINSLFWQPAEVCDSDGLNCYSSPEPFPFVIVSPGDTVEPGRARVNVSLTPVPEPSSLVLAATGLIGIARSLRRRAGAGRVHKARG